MLIHKNFKEQERCRKVNKPPPPLPIRHHGPDSFPIFETIDSVLGGKNRVFEICDVFPVELLLHSSQSSPKQKPKNRWLAPV